MKKLALLLAVCSLAAVAQSPVNQSGGPPPVAYTLQPFYDGSSNLIYACRAKQFRQTATTFGISVSTTGQPLLTNVVVSSNAGTVNFATTFYGWVGMTLTFTGSATTALNAAYKVTAVSGSTATITTSGVADATYADATLKASTNQPMLNQSVWAIQAFVYSGTTFAGSYWANASVGEALACSNRANY
jgi:hypothetical protein